MLGYWFTWIMLTLVKTALLTGCIIGAVGGLINFTDYALLAIIFIPFSLFLLYDFIYQVLVPIRGGKGNREHKPSDTPMYMGLAPSYKEAREIIEKGWGIIWG